MRSVPVDERATVRATPCQKRMQHTGGRFLGGKREWKLEKHSIQRTNMLLGDARHLGKRAAGGFRGLGLGSANTVGAPSRTSAQEQTHIFSVSARSLSEGAPVDKS